MSHFVFLAANTSFTSHLFLILLCKNTSPKQHLLCKSWLGLVFLRNEIREKREWDKVLTVKNKKCDTEFWIDFINCNYLFVRYRQEA